MAAAEITCAVNVTPKSGKDEVLGLVTGDDGAQEVKVRVTAAPENGKANKAVCKLIASSLGIAKSAVSVKRGDTSHHKLLALLCEARVYEAWFAQLPRI